MRYEDASQISTDVTARDDTEHLAGNDFGPATGNLLTGTGTVSGATGTDSGGSIPAIAGAGGSDDSFDSNGMLEVAGQYGTLTVRDDPSRLSVILSGRDYRGKEVVRHAYSVPAPHR